MWLIAGIKIYEFFPANVANAECVDGGIDDVYFNEFPSKTAL